MCSGRVDLSFVLRAFLNDADAVFIGGCRLNECNYITHGNYQALNMVHLCKKLLEHIGINPTRLRVEFMSAGEGNLFAEIMNDFSKQIRDLGPLGKGEGENIGEDELKTRLRELLKIVPYIKLAKKEKLESRLSSLDQYDQFYTSEEIDELLRDVVSYYIDPAKCQACGICARKCPVEAIDGGKNRIHIIDQDKCIKCGTCFEACPPKFQAITKIIHETVPEPVPEEERMLVRKGASE
jgi:F420-non-reducing hydrogenase iron-sulfur subunit